MQYLRYGYNPYNRNRQGFFFYRKSAEEQEITLGPVVARPGLGISTTYSSNIALWQNHRREDLYTSIFPAFMLTLPYRTHSLECEYLGKFSLYSRYSHYDVQDHFFAARANLRLAKTMHVSLESTFGILHTATEDIPDPPDDPDNPVDPAQIAPWDDQFNRRRALSLYQNSAGLQYSKKRFGAAARYLNVIDDFHRDVDRQDNYLIHNPMLDLRYQVLSRTHLLLGYSFRYMDNEQAPPPTVVAAADNTEHSLLFGTESRLLKKTVVRLTGSYNWLAYPEESLSTEYWGGSCQLRYTPVERLVFAYEFGRFSRTSFTYTGERSLRGVAFSVEMDHSASVEYRLRKLILWANFVYRNFRYTGSGFASGSSANEIAPNIQAILKLRHWLYLGAMGGYNRNDSEISGESFEEMRGQFYLQAAF